MDPVTGGWLGLASLLIHTIQGGVTVARHFKLKSKCCGVESGIDWDVTTSPDKPSDKEEPLKINIPAHQGALETGQGK